MLDRSERSLLTDLPRLTLLAIAAFFVLAPYIWMVAVSMKPQDEVFAASLSLIPHKVALVENFGKVFATIPVLTYVINGIVVCLGILVFQILFAVPAAYALAKLTFPGRDILFGFVMLGLLVPYQTTSLPLYIGFHHAGLLDTYAGLIAPFVCSVFAIFLFRQFFRALPDDLINAARIDGMGEFPSSGGLSCPMPGPRRPLAIFSVVAHWNDLFWPLIAVQKGNLFTPAMGILAFRSAEAGEDYGVLMAAALLVTLPLVLAFLFAQRRFIEGIAMTGLKG